MADLIQPVRSYSLYCPVNQLFWPHWPKMTARFKVVALKPNIIFFTYMYIGCSKKMFLKSALGVKSKF